MNSQQALGALRWFLNDAPGEMGLKSNYSSFEAHMAGVWGPANAGPAAIDTRRLQAADRYMVIQKALQGVPYDNAKVLIAFCREINRDPYVAVVEMLPETMAAHLESSTTRPISDWIDRLGNNRAGTRLWTRLKADAVTLVNASVRRFQAEVRWGI